MSTQKNSLPFFWSVSFGISIENTFQAANYLDIPGIVDITTQKIASMADGKTVEQLREIYGLENDFTPEEEEEIKQRFAWVEV